MDASTWTSVERIRAWLDAEGAQAPELDVRLLRVLKIGEELGEVSEALMGAFGANPRKGSSHTWEDVQKELCDVAVTTLVALATLTPDAEKVLDARLQLLVDRVLPPSGGSA